MAMYTMELRVYIEKFSQFDENLTNDERIEVGREKLFDFDYPIFDENYRSVFETNFIREFYMREIGFETEELFKHRLKTWLNIHMPYWNEMYESELLEFNPLINSQMTVAHELTKDKDKEDDRQINQTSKTAGEGSSNVSEDRNTTGERVDDSFTRRVRSDTPQSRLRLTSQDGRGVIEHASEIDEDKTNNKQNTRGQQSTNADVTEKSKVDSNANQSDTLNSKENEVEHFTLTKSGKIGVQSYGKLLRDYRTSLIRIDAMIHNEMQELFMLVY